jgi:hypothetical protein
MMNNDEVKMKEEKRKLQLDIAEVIDAFEMGSIERQNYLDLETGAILFGASPDVEFELRRIQDELSSEESAHERLVEYIEQREMQDWLKAEVLQAVEIEESFGTRFIAIPWIESHDRYRDMELFIDTVEDKHLRQLLSVAINGRGAFRRFKDVLLGHPDERERWFAFKRDRSWQRVVEWLEDEGIEVVE